MPASFLRRLVDRRPATCPRPARARLSLLPLEDRVVPSTLYVDDDKKQYPAARYTLIQSAINAARAGDTVLVYPGLYKEVVTVNKTLTLRAQGVPPAVQTDPVTGNVIAPGTRTGDPRTEAVITAVSTDPQGIVNLWANDVVFQGFTVGAGVNYRGVSFLGNTKGPGIFAHPEYSGYVIKDNLSWGNNAVTSDPYAPSGGLHLNSHGEHLTVVQGNAFRNHTAESAGDGLYTEMAIVNAQVVGNYFDGNVHYSIDFAGAADPLPKSVLHYGIKQVYGQSSNVLIQNNSIVQSGGVLVQYANGITVSGNTIAQATRTGIYVGGNVNGVTVSGNTLDGASIVDNMYRHGKHTGIFVGTLDIAGPITGVLVSGNSVTGYRNGLWLAGDPSTGAVSGVTVDGNWFTNSGDPYGNLYNSDPYGCGIVLTDANNNTISNNQASGNPLDGIYVDAASVANLFSNNNMLAADGTSNGRYDVHDLSSGGLDYGTANTWSGDNIFVTSKFQS